MLLRYFRHNERMDVAPLFSPQSGAEEEQDGEDFQTPYEHHQRAHPFRQSREASIRSYWGEVANTHTYIAYCTYGCAYRQVKRKSTGAEYHDAEEGDCQVEKHERHDVVDGLLRYGLSIEFGRNNRIRMDASAAFSNAIFQKQNHANLLHTASRRARTTA